VPGVTEPPDKLLDLIYDAATEQELWTSALIQIADMTGSLGGFVVGVENKDRLVPFLFNGRMSEESHRTYAERHIDNPWSAVMNHVPGGKLVQSAEIISLPDLKRTAFFDEVLRPQRMAHNAMLTLSRKDGRTVVKLSQRNPAQAVKDGVAAKAGMGRVMIGSMIEAEAVVTINRQTIKVAPGAGQKGGGPRLDLKPGRYKASVKVPGKPAFNEDVTVVAGETLGLLIGPGGVLPLQVY